MWLVSNFQLLTPRVVGRRSIHAWNFSAHRAQIRGQLPSVMHRVEKRKPQQSSNRVLEQNFLFGADDPGLMGPHAFI